MLKKLVKYGNSNALILDKAILELLEIEEGATLKIRTDGKSLILSPLMSTEKTKTKNAQETFTHADANLEATIKESLKNYSGLEKDESAKLEKEYQDWVKKIQKLNLDLVHHPKFIKEMEQINKKFDPSSLDYMEAYQALRKKLSPDLIRLEKEAIRFQNKLSEKGAFPALDEKQQSALMQKFMLAHKKNSSVSKAYEDLLNNPEYQHQAQLLAEKYNADKDSDAYLSAMTELNDKYLPEFRQYQEELKAIALQHFTEKK